MAIEINNVSGEKINIVLAKKVINQFLQKFKKTDYDISLAFVGDREIRKINKKYRNKDKVTDVLSFEGEDDFLGEIIISYPQISRQADKFSKNQEDEMVYIIVHGLLHLLGYEDETESGSLLMKEVADDFIDGFLKK